MSATTGTLAAITAAGLPSDRPPVVRPLDGASWRHLVSLVTRHRLVGLLAASVHDGHLAATAEQVEEVDDLHVEAMSRVLGLERALVRLSRLLHDRGVVHRVLKGPALAHLAYPDPGLRVFGDLDVLVAGRDLEVAASVLAEAGFQPWQPRLGPGFDARFGKGVSLSDDTDLEVDLHRTLVMGPYGFLLDVDRLLAVDPAVLRLAGQDLPAPTLEQLLLHACYTAGIADIPARWVTLRDIAQLLLSTDADQREVWDLAGEFGARTLVAWAVTAVWDRLGLRPGTVLHALARNHQPSTRDLQWRRAHQRGRYAALVGASLTVIPEPVDRLRLLRAVAVPSRAFLDERGETRTSWALRGARALWPGSGGAT